MSESFAALQDSPFRVLSIDGGGIRGLYTASLLRQLCNRLGPDSDDKSAAWDLGAQFDLIVGTSTGSILAMALAAAVPLKDVISLYLEGHRIFQKPDPSSQPTRLAQLAGFAWVLGRLFRAANRPEPLREALRSVLKDETLGDLYRRRSIALCIPSINAHTQQGWVFKTPHTERLNRDNATTLVDICMASSAAPIFFPLHGIQEPHIGSSTTHWFVDGGLWANNPVLVALAEAIEIAPNRRVDILSVGTSSAPKANLINARTANRGVWRWRGGANVVTMSLESQANTTAYLAARISTGLRDCLLHRLEEPPVTAEESAYLGLDTVSSEAIDVLLKRAARAADINVSALTRVGLDPARQAARDVFATLEKLGDNQWHTTPTPI